MWGVDIWAWHALLGLCSLILFNYVCCDRTLPGSHESWHLFPVWYKFPSVMIAVGMHSSLRRLQYVRTADRPMAKTTLSTRYTSLPAKLRWKTPSFWQSNSKWLPGYQGYQTRLSLRSHGFKNGFPGSRFVFWPGLFDWLECFMRATLCDSQGFEHRESV